MRPIYHAPFLNPPSTTLRACVFAYALLQKTNRHVPIVIDYARNCSTFRVECQITIETCH